MVRLWRWFWGLDESAEHRALRARCEALGFALPRTLAETAADRPRVAARKRRAVQWRRPSPDEHVRYGAAVDVFADFFHAIATVEGETWLIGERTWSGFPDPDMYGVVFLDRAERVIAAAEMDRLPRSWVMPPANPQTG